MFDYVYSEIDCTKCANCCKKVSPILNERDIKKLDGLTVEKLIEQFKSVRKDTIGIVREMMEQDFNREGMHPFHGHGKLERFIIWAYEHVRIHEDDIRKILRIKLV